MPEPTDRPGPALTGGAQPPSPPPRPLVQAPEVRADAAEGPDYRPLALAAIAGFSLAALYAAFLVVCFLAAWFAGTPLLMSAVTLLVPLAALVVSALGWLQVQRSEGTRAGAKLALWGMALSALFGLTYSAYLFASFAALRQQAERFADNWLGLVREHKYDEAFRLTREPGERPREGAGLRRELELRFNSGPDGGPPGPFTFFGEANLTRLLNHGVTAEDGADTQITPLGAQSWEYKNGGYQLLLVYDVRTPAGSAEVQLTLRGTERKGEPRLWTVLLNDSGMTPRQTDSPPPLQGRLMELRESSSTFLQDWLKKLGDGRLGEAYLDTQDPGRRAALRAEYDARQLAGAVGAAPDPARGALLADPEAARRLYLPGYREFTRGDLVQAAPDTFWADERLRQEIPDTTRKLFEKPAELLVPSVRLNPVFLPLWTRQDGRLRFYHDVTLTVLRRYVVVGWFVVETDARALDDTNPNPPWRLTALELATGRTLSGPALQRLQAGGGALP